jgi:Uncharacterised protein family (UPF0158)
MPVRFSDLFEAFLFASFGQPYENDAYLSKESGHIYMHSEYVDMDELPEDIEDGNKYIQIPHKNDLDLGRRLVFVFVSERLPNELDEVERYFSRRGAYARFKDFLARKGALDAWYEYEASAQRKALREWCEENSIEISDESES